MMLPSTIVMEVAMAAPIAPNFGTKTMFKANAITVATALVTRM